MQPDPSTGQASEVHPVQQVVVEPTVDPVIKELAIPGPTVALVLKEASILDEKNLPLNPKIKTVVVLEEEVDPSASDRGKIPLIEPETTAEAPINP
ncbi:hypothetical protein ACFX11_014872 [Malus domestica]